MAYLRPRRGVSTGSGFDVLVRPPSVLKRWRDPPARRSGQPPYSWRRALPQHWPPTGAHRVRVCRTRRRGRSARSRRRGRPWRTRRVADPVPGAFEHPAGVGRPCLRGEGDADAVVGPDELGDALGSLPHPGEVVAVLADGGADGILRSVDHPAGTGDIPAPAVVDELTAAPPPPWLTSINSSRRQQVRGAPADLTADIGHGTSIVVAEADRTQDRAESGAAGGQVLACGVQLTNEQAESFGVYPDELGRPAAHNWFGPCKTSGASSRVRTRRTSHNVRSLRTGRGTGASYPATRKPDLAIHHAFQLDIR